MPEGVDISEHQGDIAPEWFDQWDYCIIRAFNENGYPDTRFWTNWARAAGRTKRGVYGWPTPFIDGDDFALGQMLVTAIPGAEAGYWADVEGVRGGLASAEETEAYLRGIEAAGGMAGFYSTIGECHRTPYLDAHPWWMADYGPNDGTRHDPNEQAPRPARDYVIHQYTSYPGLDRNYSENLDWTGSAPAPAPPEDEDIMYIAVGNAVMGRIAFTVDGGHRVGPIFDGPIGAYDIPQSALDWNAERGLKFVGLDDARFAAVIGERPDGGPVVPAESLEDYSDAQIVAEVNGRMSSGALLLTGVLADV